MDKQEASKCLNDFKNDLSEFKKLLISSKHPTMSKIAMNHELIAELRSKLQSSYSQIKHIILELGDKPNIMDGMPPSPCDAYDAALDEDNGRLFKTLPALELISDDLTKIRKKILLIDDKSFKKAFGQENKVIQKTRAQDWKFFLGAFAWLSKSFNFCLDFLCNFALKHTLTAVLISIIILILVSLII